MPSLSVAHWLRHALNQYLGGHGFKSYGGTLTFSLFHADGNILSIIIYSPQCKFTILHLLLPLVFDSMYHRIVYCTLIFCFDFQPFGEGLVTVTVPQLRRGEHSLSLWNIPNINSPMPNPVNTFVGHSDMVLEFQWRSQVQDGKPV